MVAKDETAPTEAPAEGGDIDIKKKKKKKDLPMDLVRRRPRIHYAPVLTHAPLPTSYLCALCSTKTGRRRRSRGRCRRVRRSEEEKEKEGLQHGSV